MLKSIEGLNKTLDNRYRLGIAIQISELEEVSFTALKKNLGISDGNLASHIKILEREDYIGIRKGFNGRKPLTTYYLTIKGQDACEAHILNLKKLLRPFN